MGKTDARRRGALCHRHVCAKGRLVKGISCQSHGEGTRNSRTMAADRERGGVLSVGRLFLRWRRRKPCPAKCSSPANDQPEPVSEFHLSRGPPRGLEVGRRGALTQCVPPMAKAEGISEKNSGEKGLTRNAYPGGIEMGARNIWRARHIVPVPETTWPHFSLS
jgi:hypothetical protein